MATQSSMFTACPTLTTPPIKHHHRFPSSITFNSNIKQTARVCGKVYALGSSDANSNTGSKVPNSNYVVPMDNSSSCITRPLIEILRDLNKKIPDSITVKHDDTTHSSYIPWFHANRMLSFYAPGWCGEIRDVIFSDNGSVTVVYRVTVRGSDAEAHREATGTVSSATSGQGVDPVATAEEIAFCKACARFGLGLYMYHED
ncbi:DNA repair RAD52-like protein 2, chloroplastic [Bidens hawaiensis]|uniref:DNA repair RAD52-like protein 2, chloroplastic n=1 Tax=Bidens hawaiensis TaxID=980011 RepID=UPI00404914B7